MRDVSALRDLVRRIRQLAVGKAGLNHRMLDAEIYIVVNGHTYVRQEPRHGKHPGTVISYYESGSHGVWSVRSYTRRLDDAFYLCKEALLNPGDVLAETMADAEFGQSFDPKLDFPSQLACRIVATVLDNCIAEELPSKRRA